MPAPRTYFVSFTPAEKTDYGFKNTVSLSAKRENHTVTADNFAALETEVRRLAREFGQSCCPYIRQPQGERKAPGFDKWEATMQFIEYVPDV